jgi:hypothetical protein
MVSLFITTMGAGLLITILLAAMSLTHGLHDYTHQLIVLDMMMWTVIMSLLICDATYEVKRGNAINLIACQREMLDLNHFCYAKDIGNSPDSGKICLDTDNTNLCTSADKQYHPRVWANHNTTGPTLGITDGTNFNTVINPCLDAYADLFANKIVNQFLSQPAYKVDYGCFVPNEDPKQPSNYTNPGGTVNLSSTLSSTVITQPPFVWNFSIVEAFYGMADDSDNDITYYGREAFGDSNAISRGTTRATHIVVAHNATGDGFVYDPNIYVSSYVIACLSSIPSNNSAS